MICFGEHEEAVVAAREAEAEEAMTMGDHKNQGLAVEGLSEIEATEITRPHVTQVAPGLDLDTKEHRGVEAEVTDLEEAIEIGKEKGVVVAKDVVWTATKRKEGRWKCPTRWTWKWEMTSPFPKALRPCYVRVEGEAVCQNPTSRITEQKPPKTNI